MTGHNQVVNEIRRRVDELAELMSEFNLEEASLQSDTWLVSFKKSPSVNFRPATDSVQVAHQGAMEVIPEPVTPKGTPVTSPMTGVYYSSPSPGAPEFVKMGSAVTVGQVIGLIEAMKVFNEITAPTSGVIGQMVAQNGQIVQPGEPILYIEYKEW
jgi:acetyl-CoA carboxylase biotin carboxyl carrier protein